jgi:hypothetical protein
MKEIKDIGLDYFHLLSGSVNHALHMKKELKIVMDFSKMLHITIEIIKFSWKRLKIMIKLSYF